MAEIHAGWVRVATQILLVLALAVGYLLTYKYNISEEQGGGRTEGSKWPLLDLSKLNLEHVRALQYVDSP